MTNKLTIFCLILTTFVTGLFSYPQSGFAAGNNSYHILKIQNNQRAIQQQQDRDRKRQQRGIERETTKNSLKTQREAAKQLQLKLKNEAIRNSKELLGKNNGNKKLISDKNLARKNISDSQLLKKHYLKQSALTKKQNENRRKREAANKIALYSSTVLSQRQIPNTAKVRISNKLSRLKSASHEASVKNNGVLDGANFSQKTFGKTFHPNGKFSGKTIDDVASALTSKKLNVTDVPIDYIVRNGNTLILNTRSSQALTQAGIPRSQWNAVNRTGNGPYEARLTAQLERNKLTDTGISIVRQSGGQ